MSRDDLDTETHRLRETALEELQNFPQPPSGIAVAFNREYRNPPLTEDEEDPRLDEDDVTPVLEEMVDEGKLARVEDREGWYKLADWDDRPLRVQSVSHHLIQIDGVDQLEEIWLDESINAARYDYGIHDPRLQVGKWEEQRSYHISLANYEVLEQYREKLYELADGVRDSNPEKAKLYEGLADAADIEGQFDRREEEVVLRG